MKRALTKAQAETLRSLVHAGSTAVNGATSTASISQARNRLYRDYLPHNHFQIYPVLQRLAAMGLARQINTSSFRTRSCLWAATPAGAASATREGGAA